MNMKGSDLLPISTYDSWRLLWNPDLIFLTSSNIDETNTAENTSVYDGKYWRESSVTHDYTETLWAILEHQQVFSLVHSPEIKSELSNIMYLNPRDTK